MNRVLLVGGSGQLGAVIAADLVWAGYRVRALVRRGSEIGHLKALGVDLVYGDLLNLESLKAPCEGMEYVISTATGHIPSRPSDDFSQIDTLGYRALINAARRAGIHQFVYISGLVTPRDHAIPLCRFKRATEAMLVESGVPFTILRCDAFMEVFFALMGSDIPLRGVTNPRCSGHSASHIGISKTYEIAS